MARRDDLLDAAGWATAGGVLLFASWRMDRLDSRGINPWSVPGLTPGLVGALIIALALLLALGARYSSEHAPKTAPADGDGDGDGDGETDTHIESESDTHPGTSPLTALRRSAGALVLCLLFGAVSLGRGVPFAVQAAVFIFSFTTLFSWSIWRAAGRIRRALVQTALIAVVAAVAIAWLFESVFLVRLP